MRIRNRAAVLALAALLALCAGCLEEGAAPSAAPPAPALTAQDEADIDAMLDAQLGLLKDQITEAERERARGLLARAWPLRQERLEAGTYAKSTEEARLYDRLNQLYERYTVKYIENGGTWGYGSAAERTLATYYIKGGTDIRPDPTFSAERLSGWTEEDFLDLWDQMRAMLPQGAYDDFSRFTVFTDGESNTLAYVAPADSQGDKWEIAVDPADSQDGQWFTETVLHEYCHYLTLNDEQVTYTDRQTADTYNEEGMVSAAGSYLDDFYQQFWTDYLDDRLANMDSYNFFLRHEDDFVTDYASTDPAEDIAESFTYFVVYGPQPGDAVWERKLNFFYDYPELVDFRSEVRLRLGYDG